MTHPGWSNAVYMGLKPLVLRQLCSQNAAAFLLVSVYSWQHNAPFLFSEVPLQLLGCLAI